MKHTLKCDFGAVIGIRKVLGSWEDHCRLEKAARAEESGQTEEGVINPMLLLRSDGKLRLGQAKHATVISEPKQDFTACADESD
jgi:hypothetical protein